MALTFTVHNFKKVGNDLVLEKVTPYVAIKPDRRDGVDPGYYYLQTGLCYPGKNGKPLKSHEIPDDVWGKMRDMNRKVLEEVGWFEKMQEHFEQPAKPKEKVLAKAKRKAGRPRKVANTEEGAPATE